MGGRREWHNALASCQHKISENEEDNDKLQTRLQDMRTDQNNARRRSWGCQVCTAVSPSHGEGARESAR
ncbi:hypothetical protein GGF50DRAFT_122018 [Schizophyllum commune]